MLIGWEGEEWGRAPLLRCLVVRETVRGETSDGEGESDDATTEDTIA